MKHIKLKFIMKIVLISIFALNRFHGSGARVPRKKFLSATTCRHSPFHHLSRVSQTNHRRLGSKPLLVGKHVREMER